ncbi:hypothetical protein AB0D49_02410 [Streptomyces sp. NPDC048290]|uniref:hypothetical protein n=1 Tax=Streptomyces sp. NPDC048290 TaxID=3155811 RepID=UPI00341A1CDE
MSLKRAILNVSGGLTGLQGKLDPTARGMNALQKAASGAGGPLSQLRNTTTQTGTAFGKFRTSTNSGDTAVRQFNSGVRTLDSSLGKSKGGVDRLKSAFDKLRGTAKALGSELRGIKKGADGVQTSVGQAAKNADKGEKSMGNLGKGLKGASLAQKGLNLAMAASPFGLVMTLLAPLISQFVNMDKVTAVLRKGVQLAMKHIGTAVGAMSKNAVPILKGLGNVILSPFTGLAVALNALFGILAGIRISVPDWVPKYGGRGFSFPRLSVPVPRLATGGVVQARSGGTLALLGEAGEHEAVVPLSKLDRMLGQGGGLRTLTAAVERLADRPVVVQVDSQEIARAVFLGQRQLARR